MEFTVFRDQENANNVTRNNKENNMPKDLTTKRRTILGLLNPKQPTVKQPLQKAKVSRPRVLM